VFAKYTEMFTCKGAR